MERRPARWWGGDILRLENMKGSIETMLGIILLAFMALLGTSYITASLTTQKAQNYHAAVVAELEASDFSTSVVSSCKTKAKDNGYKT